MPKRLFILFRNLLSRQKIEQDLDEEIESSLEILTQEKLKAGLSASEARRQALIELGGVDQVKEEVRTVRIGHSIDALTEEVKYAARSVIQKRLFASGAVLTCAIGIAALTSVFSLFRSALIHPLPFEREEPLIAVTDDRGAPYSVSPPYYLQLTQRSRSFDRIGMYTTKQVDFRTGETREWLAWASVTAGVFEMLKTRPLRGRVFGAGEDLPGGPNVAMISAAFWRNRLGGQEDVLGRQIEISGTGRTIIGILPDYFQFPAKDVEVWTPLHVDFGPILYNARARIFQIAASLRPGFSVDQAAAEFRYNIGQIDREFSGLSPSPEPALMHYRDYVVGNYRPAYLVLLLAGLFVMAIACANMTNLFAIRSVQRCRERALCVVLGAGKGRLLARPLFEALLISAAGSALGVLLAWWSLTYMKVLARESIPRLNEATIGLEGIGLATALAVTTAVIASVLPAFKSPETSLASSLSMTPMVSGQNRSPMRRFLVMLQFSLAVILMIGAGLMIRSLHNLLNIGLNFNPDNVLTFSPKLPPSLYPSNNRRLEFTERLEQHLSNLPGVVAVGATNTLPLGILARRMSIRTEKDRQTKRQLSSISCVVSSGYFRAMGIPILRGRYFTEFDRNGKEQVVIIDESLATHFWPNDNPIGKQLFVDVYSAGAKPEPEAVPLSVVGVVPTVTRHAFRRVLGSGVETGQYYRPSGCYMGTISEATSALIGIKPGTADVAVAAIFTVRTQGDPMMLADAVRHEFNALDKEVVPGGFTTIENLWLDFSAERRFYMTVLNIFGLYALLLAAVGIYGVVAFSISQRTHEFGVRVALGAKAVQILRLVMLEGLRWVVTGTAVGCFAGMALSRYISSMLFEVSGRDTLTIGSCIVILSFVAFLGCYFPARRATRLDPLAVLRAE